MSMTRRISATTPVLPRGGGGVNREPSLGAKQGRKAGALTRVCHPETARHCTCTSACRPPAAPPGVLPSLWLHQLLSSRTHAQPVADVPQNHTWHALCTMCKRSGMQLPNSVVPARCMQSIRRQVPTKSSSKMRCHHSLTAGCAIFCSWTVAEAPPPSAPPLQGC